MPENSLDQNGRDRLIALGVLLAGFALVSCLLFVLDATVILLHVLFSFLVFGLVFRIVRKLTGKQTKVYWQGWLALLTAAVYLTVGYVQCVHVWKTEYSLASEKSVEPLRIALLSDSHVGTTFDGEGFAALLEEIMRQEPDLILIPGDFVDDSTTRADLLTACRALGQLDHRRWKKTVYISWQMKSLWSAISVSSADATPLSGSARSWRHFWRTSTRRNTSSYWITNRLTIRTKPRRLPTSSFPATPTADSSFRWERSASSSQATI